MIYKNKMMTTRPDLVVQLLRPEPPKTEPVTDEPHQDDQEQAPELKWEDPDTTEEN